MRLIDADEVQKVIDHIRTKYVDTYNRRTKVNQFFWDTIRYIEKKVRSIPSVEAVPVVHGKWISDLDANGKLKSVWRGCSVCGCLNHSTKPNFCPNCGAKMDGES